MLHIIQKRIGIAISATVAIVILAYVLSFQTGVRNSALLAVLAIAVVWFAVRRPAWVIVSRVNSLGLEQSPVLTISYADVERYPSLVRALYRAEDAYIESSGLKIPASVSRIHKNEAYSILSLLRSQDADVSSREFYVEYDGKTFHSRLHFQHEKPKTVQ